MENQQELDISCDCCGVRLTEDNTHLWDFYQVDGQPEVCNQCFLAEVAQGHGDDETEDEELLCERCDRLLNLPMSYSGGVCFDCLQREGKLSVMGISGNEN